MIFEEKEIETKSQIDDWSQVKICENGEALVELKNNEWPQLIAKNKYYEDRLPGAIRGIWVRKSVKEMLKKLSEILPDNTLLVWDGWRPTSVQAWLHSKVNRILKNCHQNSEDVLLEAEKYAADPKDTKNRVPPHITGGAIDICLCDANGRIFEMGTPLDYFGDQAATCYFEHENRLRKLNKNELLALRNRRILFWAMTQAGFTNYQYEWWHFDYGDQLWGMSSGREAFYDAIEL